MKKWLKDFGNCLLILAFIAGLIAAGVFCAELDWGVFHDKYPKATVFDWLWSGGN